MKSLHSSHKTWNWLSSRELVTPFSLLSLIALFRNLIKNHLPKRAT